MNAITSLAYLKTPDKVRAALINTTGGAPPLSVIERELKKCEWRPRRDVGEPEDYDGVEYAPRRSSYHSTVQAEYRRECARIEREREKSKGRDQIDREAVARAAERLRRAQELRTLRGAVQHEPSKFSQKLAVEVCRGLGLKVEQFFSDSRSRAYVHARALVAVLLRERDPSIYSFPKIAACVGRKDHSTMIHAIEHFPLYCRANPDLFELYKALGGKDV